jgi:hypothetical protein
MRNLTVADVMTLSTAEKIFNLPDPYDYADVKAAYRRLIMEKHPDVRKDVDSETANREASEINAANKILTKRCKDMPETKFACQSGSHSSTIFTQASTYSPQESYSGYEEPKVDVHEYEWEIPIENVTWEELFNDVWASFNDSRVAARKAEGRENTFNEWTKDAAADVFAWAARNVARRMDAKTASTQVKTTKDSNDVDTVDYMQKNNSTSPDPQSESFDEIKIDYEDYAKYERS